MPRRSGSVVSARGARGVVWRLRYADASGRRVCETLGLESDGWTQRAEEALRERLVDVKRDKLTRARPLQFAEFARDALETYLDAKGRRHSTRSGYLAVVDQHLVPFFGRMQLDSIEPADVDAYVAKKRRAGLSAATVNRQLNVLRRVCKLAVRAGKMRSNPVLSVEALEEPDRRLRWRRLQPEEVGAVAHAFDELIVDADRDERPWIEQARVVFLVV
jgi:site-specific recombinase XerD